MSTNYRELGNQLFKNNNFEEAAKLYSRGLEQEPQSAVLYNNRAACYLSLKKFKEAEDDAQISIGIDPTAKGYARLARAQIGLGKFDVAKVNMEKATKLEPDNTTFRDELAALNSGNPTSSSSAGAGGFFNNKRLFFYLDMGVILLSIFHLIFLMLMPGIGIMLWKFAVGGFGIRQFLGMRANGSFPALNTQFFSNITSHFHGQFFLLALILIIASSPPIHLLLLAFSIYCFLDAFDTFRPDLENVVAKLPGFVRGFVQPQLDKASSREGRQYLLVNATACEIMSVIFAPLAGGGFMMMFVLGQFVKWRYQTDQFVKHVFTQMHLAIMQLTQHQYCPTFVRPVYVKVSDFIHSYATK
jgi:tetratricopeptide (TPR) repeat protein